MNQQQAEEQQTKEREDRPTGWTFICPFTLSPVDGSARLCLGIRCLAFLPRDPMNPELGGICGRCFGRWMD